MKFFSRRNFLAIHTVCTTYLYNAIIVSTGAYLFKAYSNGHPYDTSQVWVALFTALLKEEGGPSPGPPGSGSGGPSPSPSPIAGASAGNTSTGTTLPPLLPAVIVPAGYPNQRTWEALRRYSQDMYNYSLHHHNVVSI